jgi:hypothetical protein
MFRRVPLPIISSFSLYTQQCCMSYIHKYEKLMNLVGFIIRIFHDVRSPERQIRMTNLVVEPQSRRIEKNYYKILCLIQKKFCEDEA